METTTPLKINPNRKDESNGDITPAYNQSSGINR